MKKNAVSLLRLSFTLLPILLLTACEHFPARINHRHNEDNQKLAQQNVDNFQDTAGQNANLLPTLLSNVAAQEQLARTVADHTSRVNDTDQIIALTDQTWDGLRVNLFKDCGLIPPESTKTSWTADELDAMHAELEVKLAGRLDQVNIIASVLVLLADWNQVLVEQSTADVKKAEQKLADILKGGNNETGDTNPPPAASSASFADLFKSFQDAVIKAGHSQLTNNAVLTNTSALVRSILEGAENSRDPASVYALAPLIGSGLDTNSATLLTNYIAYLKTNIDLIDVTKIEDKDSQKNIREELVKLKQRLGWSEKQGKRNAANVTTFYALDKNNVKTEVNAEKFVRTTLNAVSNVSQRLPEIAKVTAKANKQLGFQLDQFSRTFQQVEQAGGALSGGLNSTNLSRQLALALAARDPKLAQVLNNTNILNPEDVKQINQAISDINDERLAAAQLVAEYFRDISSLDLNLHEENLRHFQTISVVASKELDRWHLMGRYVGNFKTIFKARNEKGGDNALPRLFGSNLTDEWKLYYTNNPTPANAPFRLTATGILAPPDISTTNEILPSIRLLAENAKAWQTASPSQSDPLGLATARSMQRLVQGVRLIQGYLLITSMSQRMSEDNGIRLRTETMEHGIHLDAIVARVEEANLRYGLKDLLAFHRSGITEADVQATVGIVQSALLAWIGAKL